MTMKMLVAVAMIAAGGPVAAQGASAPVAIKAAELGSVPVIAGDISDRPYTVVGEITAGVRKATVFSKAASQDKIYRELWERAQKLGADAVVHASYGESHISAMSWGQTTATGIAIKFNAPAPAVAQ